jgi:hypothetical protein
LPTSIQMRGFNQAITQQGAIALSSLPGRTGPGEALCFAREPADPDATTRPGVGWPRRLMGTRTASTGSAPRASPSVGMAITSSAAARSSPGSPAEAASSHVRAETPPDRQERPGDGGAAARGTAGPPAAGGTKHRTQPAGLASGPVVVDQTVPPRPLLPTGRQSTSPSAVAAGTSRSPSGRDRRDATSSCRENVAPGGIFPARSRFFTRAAAGSTPDRRGEHLAVGSPVPPPGANRRRPHVPRPRSSTGRVPSHGTSYTPAALDSAPTPRIHDHTIGNGTQTGAWWFVGDDPSVTNARRPRFLLSTGAPTPRGGRFPPLHDTLCTVFRTTILR